MSKSNSREDLFLKAMGRISEASIALDILRLGTLHFEGKIEMSKELQEVITELDNTQKKVGDIFHKFNKED
jgi:hypothetical protein